MWMIRTWIQPLGIVSHVQTQTRCLCKLSARSTGRKRVQASYKLSKSNLWMETQQKRINDSHHDVWVNDHKIIRTEQKCTLAEDHTSFEMQNKTGRTNQLLCITEATGSKIYTRESESETHSKVKALVLSLKQYHTHYYRFYKKGTTRAMVGLEGLHMSNTFWHSNVSARIGLRSFYPWYFKLGRNTETIAIHLREVHYHLAISCDLCQLFTSMSVQVVLKHHYGCKIQSHKKKSKVREQEKAS